MPRGKQRSKLARKQPKKFSHQCSALTHSYDACKNRAAISRALGGLPVCWLHKKLRLTVTSCQAVLGNNRKCLKKIPWSEKQLCVEHKDFVLPCYILRLPTELRQHIFLYILDEYQSQYVPYYTYCSFINMMCLSHQIFEEATDILYRNLVCNIALSERRVYILGRRCLSVQPGSWQKFKQFCFQFEVRENPRAILENIKIVATQLRDSSIIKLNIRVTSWYIWWGCLQSAQQVYKTLPIYLDAIRQIGRVREASVTISHDPSPELRRTEYLAKPESERTELIAMELEWRRYYEEWVKDMECGRLEEKA
ncbi:hypothetical protein I7I48_04272 [Histoplasma ohiense]|nr:hypothetical protein I7I48_04272 [Histoplasma ohiense (nom. inval.)]